MITSSMRAMASSHSSKSLQSCGSEDRPRGEKENQRLAGRCPVLKMRGEYQGTWMGRGLFQCSPSWSASFSISRTFSCTKLSSSVVLAIHSISGRSSTDTTSGVKGTSGTPSGWLRKVEEALIPAWSNSHQASNLASGGSFQRAKVQPQGRTLVYADRHAGNT